MPIKLDYPKSKRLAEVICKEIKDSLSENAKTYNLIKRCENQTNQVTIWNENNKICDDPWPGASDYFIPMTEWIVDAVHSRVMYILFQQEPFMTARGTEASDVDNAPGVTDFVDMVLRETVKIYDNINFFFKQMIKNPLAVLKYDWDLKIESLMVKESAIVYQNPNDGTEEYILSDEQKKGSELELQGYIPTQETKEVWTLQDKELYNAPRLRYIRAEDYVWASTAKRDSKPYWEGDKIWLTWNEIKNKERQEIFLTDAVDKIYSFVTSFVGDNIGSDKDIAQRKILFECFNWYGRIPFDANGEINFDDKEAIEQEVYAIVAYKEGNKDVEELLYLDYWPYQRIPELDRVYIRDCFEETEEFIGRSLPMKLYKTQQLMNTFYNNLINNAYISMMKILWKKRTLVGEEWESPEIYPGVVLDVDSPGDVGVLEMGDIKSIGMGIEQQLISFAERISNISLYQTGTARQEGQKTKGEVMATISEGNIGLDKLIQRCHNILRKICKWTVAYYYERMPEGLERRIRGEQGDEIFPTNKNMAIFQQKGIQPYWTKDMIAGQFDFTWNGTSLNSDRDRNLFISNDLMDRYLPQPMVQGSMLATWDILRRGLVARNIKDWQTILPSKEAIVQEMQNMENEAKLRKQMAGIPPEMKQRVAKKLIAKGVPADVVMKNMEEGMPSLPGGM